MVNSKSVGTTVIVLVALASFAVLFYSSPSIFMLPIFNPSGAFNGTPYIPGPGPEDPAIEYTWLFDTPSNYNFDASDLHVSINNVSLLKVPNPYAAYHLNEASGSTAPDSSGNGRHGSLISMEDSDWESGKLGNCLEFDWNEYVSLGSSTANFDYVDSFSVEAWVRPASTTTQMIVSKKATTGSQTGWQFYLTSSGNVGLQLVSVSGSNQLVVSGSSTISTGSWTHVVFTYDGTYDSSGVNLYVNSAKETLTVSSNTLSSSITNSINCQISGKSGSNQVFDGAIDEVIIYDYELLQEDINFRYNGYGGTEEFIDRYIINNPTIDPKSSIYYNKELYQFIESANKPEGTDIKYQVSTDNGNNWLYHNGLIWTTSSGSYTESNSANEINSNLSTLSSSGYFKFKALLNSNGTLSPILESIYFTTI